MENVVLVTLDSSVGQLSFRRRTTNNLLHKDGIATIDDLLYCTEEDLLDIRHFGPVSLEDVKQALAEYGLTLRHVHAE